MILHTLPNLSSHSASIEDDFSLSQFKNPRPLGQTKEQFREWCTASTTQSKFISVWQGVTAKARIAANNPATKLHGIIGDYDSPSALASLPKLPQSCGHLPTWVTSTFTAGKARLIWPFQEPINIGNSELTERFIAALDKRIRFSKALPDFDKCSIEDNQYFEVGTDWRDVEGATPISTAMIEMCMIEAGTSAKITTSDIEIPIEHIAAEVARQYPGRWAKPFEVGQRGPLFWINDGIDREGCVVTENGMVCFSDRAASNFMPWRAVLGQPFVREYEENMIGSAAQLFYFAGRAYWRKNKGNWHDVTREDARLQLKVKGVSDRPRRGQSVSDIERVLEHVQLNRRVTAAAPFLFRREEVVDWNAASYLNTSNRVAMQPAPEGQGTPDKFPLIHKFIGEAFDNGEGWVEGTPQAKDYFLGWLHHFYSSALELNLQPGQILVIAGKVGTGKSLFNRWLIGGAVGGSCTATDVLMKQTAFNKEAGQNGHLLIDDAPTDGNQQEKRKFANKLKEFAANPVIPYQPKNVDKVDLPFRGRVGMTMNDDPESLGILPPMDGSFKDKIMLFKLRDDFKPKFLGGNKDEKVVLEELPFFLRWLLDWGNSEARASVLNKRNPRYAIKAFHHPALVEASHAETVEYSIQEMLELWSNGKASDKNAKTEYLGVELLQELKSTLPDVTRMLNTVSLGRSLTKLIESKAYPKLVEKKRTKDGWKYLFNFQI
jgi:hypothetical protein